jgi:superfamily I DNA/RNA helicase
MSAQLQRALMLSAMVLLLAFVCPLAARAQNPQPSPTPLTAPPPLKLISKEERQQIDDARDLKERLKLSIEFSSAHLSRAEQLTMQTEYEAASNEVGSYHALMEDTLENLSKLKQDSNKTRDLYKRLEMQLRADGPRLTAMRRVTPLEFAVWIKKVEDFARDGRTEALNSFYGHTVVRDKETPQKPDDKPKETPTPKSNRL